MRATLPSGRVMEMSPPSVCTVMPVMPGPRLWWTSTGTPSPCCSHEASRTPEGLDRCALTLARVIVANGWSSAEAISARQGVMRVQARSVSPAAYDARRRSSARMGRAASAASVMRRWARRPTGSSATSSGAVPGHHTTTGASGTQQRQDHRRHVVRERAAEPELGQLAGPVRTADRDLGVEPGWTAARAAGWR